MSKILTKRIVAINKVSVGDDMSNERIDQAFKAINAPAKKLYNAFLNPDDLVEWLPPSGMTGHIEHFEGHVGGRYKMVLEYNDDKYGKTTENSDVTYGIFVELIPYRKIVLDIYFETEHSEYQGKMRQIWKFDEGDTNTIVSIECHDVPEGIGQKDHEAGLSSTLKNLEKFTLNE